MRRTLISFIGGGLAAVCASVLTIAFYLIWPLGESLGSVADGSLRLSPTLLPVGLPSA